MSSEAGRRSGSAARERGKNQPDPLVVLREHTMARKKVRFEDDYIVFEGRGPEGRTRYHRETRCGYRMTEKEMPIDIGSVWYMLRETSNDRSYTGDSAARHGFRYIGVRNRGELSDYVAGRAETAGAGAMVLRERHKRPSEDATEEVRRKRPKRAAERVNGDAPAPRKGAGETDITYADVLARVRPVRDLDVLVRCPGRMVPNADLILQIAQDEWKNWNARPATRGPDPSLGAKVTLGQELEEFLRQDPKSLPIVLVPCNKLSPVNLLNAADLLQFGRPWQKNDERIRFFESTRPEVVEVSRSIMGKQWTFEVRDSTQGFSKAMWLRTVAVVSDGSDWQFKGWPFESIVDMFTTIKGIYFAPAGIEIPVHVHQWAVHILKLAPPALTHRYAAIRDAFWADVEAFMMTTRSRRFVNHTTLEGGKRVFIKPLPIL